MKKAKICRAKARHEQGGYFFVGGIEEGQGGCDGGDDGEDGVGGAGGDGGGTVVDGEGEQEKEDE